MLNTKQNRILFIAIILLYTGKIIYRYVQKNEIEYFDVGMGLFWLGLLFFSSREQEPKQ